MPEYLAPGVYVEETSFRAKSIEGVSTTTTGFVGPARYGPLDLEPEIVTNLAEFERVYGDGQPLFFVDRKFPNYMWHAVRAFFEEGGRRLYIARTFEGDAESDGRAFLKLPQVPRGSAQPQPLVVKARFPGAAGDLRIAFRLAFGGNLLAPRDDGGEPSAAPGMLRGLVDRDVVGIFMNAPELSTKILDLKAKLESLSATDPDAASDEARTLVETTRTQAQTDAELLDVTARNLKERDDVVAAEEMALLLAERTLAAATAEDSTAKTAKAQAENTLDAATARKKVAEKSAQAIANTASADELAAAIENIPWASDPSLAAENFATAAGDLSTTAQTIFNAMTGKGLSAAERSMIERLKSDAEAAATSATEAADQVKAATIDLAAQSDAKLVATLAINRVKGVATLLADLKAKIGLSAATAAETAATMLSDNAKDRADAAAEKVTQSLARVAAIEGAPTASLPVARDARAAAKAAYDQAKIDEATSRKDAREIAFALADLAGVPGGSGSGALYFAHFAGPGHGWKFLDSTGAEVLSERQLDPDPENGHKVCVATVSVTAVVPGQGEMAWSGLPLDPGHARGGEADHLLARLGENPGTLAAARVVPFAIGLEPPDAKAPNGIALAALLFDGIAAIKTNQNLDRDAVYETPLMALAGGNDGTRPGVAAYEGEDTGRGKTGLMMFEDIEDISIVAAPGVTHGMADTSWRKTAQAVVGKLIGHCERMRYRVAIIDSGDAQSVSEVRSMKAKIDSARGHGALYYPWVRIMDPITRQELNLPPSGFVAGIYARNDIERAVHKAPANEIVRGAIGFETTLNKAQQEVLNPEGVNCFRFFEGRGFRLWGARTVSSDPEWKYVNVRRYFCYLERSIDKGTQWAVFEPNGEALWANVRRTIEDFLLNEWQNGALLGDKPEKAYFVRCDRSTMSQNDLDNGRLICLIGVAPLKPAEFVIFRIGQWTADRKN